MFTARVKIVNLDDAEWEGVSGVRDIKGNFHRWHDEISLEPEGTEERLLLFIIYSCGLLYCTVVQSEASP
jgi:hypothetical protein